MKVFYSSALFATFRHDPPLQTGIKNILCQTRLHSTDTETAILNDRFYGRNSFLSSPLTNRATIIAESKVEQIQFGE